MGVPGLVGSESVVRDQLRIKNVLELGIGAGPNLRYYAEQPWVRQLISRTIIDHAWLSSFRRRFSSSLTQRMMYELHLSMTVILITATRSHLLYH